MAKTIATIFRNALTCAILVIVVMQHLAFAAIPASAASPGVSPKSSCSVIVSGDGLVSIHSDDPSDGWDATADLCAEAVASTDFDVPASIYHLGHLDRAQGFPAAASDEAPPSPVISHTDSADS